MTTQGYGGQDLAKVVTIESNDPQHPQTALKVSGKVESFASIKPDRIQLTGVAGSPVSTSVVVTPRPEYPFKVTSVQLQRGGDVRISMEPKAGQAGKPEYVVTLDNLRKEPGRYYDNLLIRTDSKVSSELRVAIYGNISKPSETGKDKAQPSVETQKPQPEPPAPAESPS